MNQMIANPEKFKAIVLKRLSVNDALSINLQNNDIRITTSSEVHLLGATNDSKSSFDSYIRNIFKKLYTSLTLCLDQKGIYCLTKERF